MGHALMRFLSFSILCSSVVFYQMKIISEEEMTTKSAHSEAYLFPIKGQILRKVVSDVSSEIEKLGNDLKTIAEVEEAIREVECYCCGLHEECTQEYIQQVKDSYSGKWVCGLCSEAVKEKSMRTPSFTAGFEEALGNHRSFCLEFNSTTRLNPKLSFTSKMREIAKRSKQTRMNSNNNPSLSKIYRSSCCVPRLV